MGAEKEGGEMPQPKEKPKEEKSAMAPEKEKKAAENFKKESKLEEMPAEAPCTMEKRDEKTLLEGELSKTECDAEKAQEAPEEAPKDEEKKVESMLPEVSDLRVRTRENLEQAAESGLLLSVLSDGPQDGLAFKEEKPAESAETKEEVAENLEGESQAEEKPLEAPRTDLTEAKKPQPDHGASSGEAFRQCIRDSFERSAIDGELGQLLYTMMIEEPEEKETKPTNEATAEEASKKEEEQESEEKETKPTDEATAEETS